jgi:hypothetical protein
MAGILTGAEMKYRVFDPMPTGPTPPRSIGATTFALACSWRVLVGWCICWWDGDGGIIHGPIVQFVFIYLLWCDSSVSPLLTYNIHGLLVCSVSVIEIGTIH